MFIKNTFILLFIICFSFFTTSVAQVTVPDVHQEYWEAVRRETEYFRFLQYLKEIAKEEGLRPPPHGPEKEKTYTGFINILEEVKQEETWKTQFTEILLFEMSTYPMVKFADFAIDDVKIGTKHLIIPHNSFFKSKDYFSAIWNPVSFEIPYMGFLSGSQFVDFKDFQYISAGDWLFRSYKDEQPISISLGMLVFGSHNTSIEKISHKENPILYFGKLSVIESDQNGNRRHLPGSVMIEVDFPKNSLILRTEIWSYPEIEWKADTMQLHLIGGDIQGTVTTNFVDEGKFRGSFYGPNGEEFAGSFSLKLGETTIIGIFGNSRQ